MSNSRRARRRLLRRVQRRRRGCEGDVADQDPRKYCSSSQGYRFLAWDFLGIMPIFYSEFTVALKSISSDPPAVLEPADPRRAHRLEDPHGRQAEGAVVR